MELLIFRVGKVWFGVPTRQVERMERIPASRGESIATYVGSLETGDILSDRCIRLKSDRLIQVSEVIGIREIPDKGLLPLPSLIRSKLPHSRIANIAWAEERGIMVLDVSA